MSSNDIATRKDASKKANFPLSPELRVKVYEHLLVHPERSLKPNGFRRYTGGRPYREKDHIFTSILQTCRTFYEEALPILYGKNTLAFHDNDFNKPVLPFPEEHLTMVKHVEVDISPLIYCSAEKMGEFLWTLGTSGAKFVDLSVRIHMLEGNDEVMHEHHPTLPPPSPFDRLFVDDHPILTGLFSLIAVNRLYIQMEDEARFEPGFADALKKAFMEEGTANGRSITIEKGCTFPHDELAGDGPCPGCGNTEEDLINGTAKWEYKDDMRSFKALGEFLYLNNESDMEEPSTPNSVPNKVTKSKQPKTKAAATKPTAKAKKTKANSAKASSKKAA